MLSIGSLNLDSRLVLGPMAGITDLPFRLLNRAFGCGLAFTEMISASTLVRKSKKTSKMLSTAGGDRPLGVQILGGDGEVIKRAIEIIPEDGVGLLDFNAACPVKKVVSKGEGAGLLREPERLQKLLKVMVQNTRLPVTVKIRTGWDESSVNAVEVACRAADAGVKGLFIHGRTGRQGYGGEVDYNTIGRVKRCLSIPVVASGDALTPDLVRKLFSETGCDGVALARGALGNPWIFRETEAYLEGGPVPSRPGGFEIAETMKKHLLLNIAFHGEKNGVMLFRKFFPWYAGAMVSKELKERAFRVETPDGMLQLIDEVRRP